MPLIYLDDIRLNASLDGPVGGPPLIFVHALGLDLTIWDAVTERLPNHRILRYDQRGHGGSDVPNAPYAMGSLIRDAERLMDHFAMRDAVIIGLSLGGMVAQGLAVKRLDLIRGMVLANTAARIGTVDGWAARIADVRAGGLEAIADAAIARWLGPRWQTHPDMPALRARLVACPPMGWMGCAAAIAGTDFYTPTASLTLPTLAIAGSNDHATPPDLVRETAELIRGSEFHLIRGAGHLPCIDAPEAFTAALTAFLRRIGHI